MVIGGMKKEKKIVSACIINGTRKKIHQEGWFVLLGQTGNHHWQCWEQWPDHPHPIIGLMYDRVFHHNIPKIAHLWKVLINDGESHLVHISIMVLLEGLNLVQTFTLLYYHAHLLKVLQLFSSLQTNFYTLFTSINEIAISLSHYPLHHCTN